MQTATQQVNNDSGLVAPVNPDIRYASPNNYMRPIYKLVAFIATAHAFLGNPKNVDAAVYSDSTNPAQVVARANPFLASNGGPSITFEAYKPDGTIISDWGGNLLTGPGGNNVGTTALHPYLQALAVDSKAKFRVITGPNFVTNKVQGINVTGIELPQGSDGTFNTLDQLGFRLETAVPNTGTFVPVSVREDDLVTTPANGIRMTVQQLQNGTSVSRDGNFGRTDAEVLLGGTAGVSDEFYNSTVYDGQVAFNGFSFSGDSGAGSFLMNTIVTGSDGKILYAEFAGTNVGHAGNGSPSAFSLITNNSSGAAQELYSRLIPEPSGILGLAVAAVGLLRRKRN